MAHAPRHAVFLLAVVVSLSCAQAYTAPDQLALLERCRDRLSQIGPFWAGAVSTWRCPTPPDNTTASQTCDPCGRAQWWGNWEHIACRGNGTRPQDVLGGDGRVTNVHFTNLKVEGPNLDVLVDCTCPFTVLKEFDIQQSNPALPITGQIPGDRIAECHPYLNTCKFSYHNLTGTLPEAFATLQSLQFIKARNNYHMHGSIPESYGRAPLLYSLEISINNFSGSIPATLANKGNFGSLLIENNSFSGDLYNLRGTKMLEFTPANNPELCGMVPATARWAHGYNPYNTQLGRPCPEASYPPVIED